MQLTDEYPIIPPSVLSGCTGSITLDALVQDDAASIILDALVQDDAASASWKHWWADAVDRWDALAASPWMHWSWMMLPVSSWMHWPRMMLPLHQGSTEGDLWGKVAADAVD